MSQRTDQVASVIHRAVSQVLSRGLSDPRVEGLPALISVTKVDVSPDMRSADVFVSVTPEQYEKRVLAALHHGTGHIQRKAFERVRLRTVPRLRFELDTSLKKEADVLAQIAEGMRRTGDPRNDPQDAPPTDANVGHDDDAPNKRSPSDN